MMFSTIFSPWAIRTARALAAIGLKITGTHRFVIETYSSWRCGRRSTKRMSLRHSEVRPLIIECFSRKALVNGEFLPDFKHLNLLGFWVLIIKFYFLTAGQQDWSCWQRCFACATDSQQVFGARSIGKFDWHAVSLKKILILDTF